ncbi:MAG: phage antirepressor [Clostridium sp.]|nr:phage antirepressor [Clostridium sp.]
MENPEIFKNDEFGTVRTLNINGEPWFVGKDIAEILGYHNTRDAIAKRVDAEDELCGVAVCDSIGREQYPVLINESGLYSMILSSKLPKAKRFKRWITSEVLPSIRRTGKYVHEKAREAEELKMRTRLAKTLIECANEILDIQSVKKSVSLSQQIYSAKEIAEILDVSVQKIAYLSKLNDMKIDEYGKRMYGSFLYNERAVEKFREILKK